MNEKLLRLISNQRFAVEPNWGLTKLQEIMFAAEMGGDFQSQIKEQRETSFQTDFYNEGSLIGTDIDDIKNGSVAVISMSGLMTVEDGMCSYGMNSMDKKLRSLYQNSAVSGIVLKVDSGGGYSSAGDILQNAIADRNKPVVAYTTFMASAAVKGTLQADERVAASTGTMIGSIGVMLVMPKWYVEESKENDIEIYSKLSDNKNGPWRAMKNGNLEPYIEQLTEMDTEFMNEVRKHLTLKGDKATVKETLSGKVFMGNEARKRGLVDRVGTLNDAINRISKHQKYFK